MGCMQSKNDVDDALHIEDSVHRLILKDKKNHDLQGKGETEILYKPRQEHPLLTQQKSPDASGHTANTGTTENLTASFLNSSKVDTKELLYLSSNHNNEIDKRDKIVAYEDVDRVVE